MAKDLAFLTCKLRFYFVDGGDLPEVQMIILTYLYCLKPNNVKFCKRKLYRQRNLGKE